MIVRELFARLGVKTDAASVKKADSAMAKLKKAAIGIGVALAARRVVSGLQDIIMETTAAADAVAKTSAKLGIGVQALQEYQYAAQIAGVPIRTFNMGLQRFTRRTAEAAMGTGEAKDALLQMGIQLKDTHGRLRPAEDLLLDVADSLSQTADEGEKVRLAFKLFDSEGVAMINMLKGGSKELIELRKRARETGGMFSKEFARAAEVTTDKLTDQNRALTDLKIAITEKLRPAFDWLIDKTTIAYRWIARITKETYVLEAALGVLGALLVGIGVKFVVAFAAPIALGLALVAVLALIVLIVDDIVSSFKGEDSLGRRASDDLGRLYDSFMKFKGTGPVMQAALEPLKVFLEALRLAKDALLALIMLAGGDTSGFKLLGEDLGKGAEARAGRAKSAQEEIREGVTDPVQEAAERTEEEIDKKVGGIADFFGMLAKLPTEAVAGLLGKAKDVGGGIVGPTPAAGLMPTVGAGQTSVTTTINSTVNATTLPGQSPEEFGEAAATAVGRKIEERMVDDARAALLPLRGG